MFSTNSAESSALAHTEIESVLTERIKASKRGQLDKISA